MHNCIAQVTTGPPLDILYHLAIFERSETETLKGDPHAKE